MLRNTKRLPLREVENFMMMLFKCKINGYNRYGWKLTLLPGSNSSTGVSRG